MNSIKPISSGVPIADIKPARVAAVVPKKIKFKVPEQTPILDDSDKVAENLAKNFEEVKETVRQLQEIAAAVGTKVHFSVNQELGGVIVSVVDPQTNRVIKEIPSAEVQEMQVRIRQTIGLLFDKTV